MTKELISKEMQIPRRYERVGNSPIELREIFKNLWTEGVFPSFEFLPSQITLTPELKNVINLESISSIENRGRESSRCFLYSPDVEILVSESKPGTFGGVWVRRSAKRTLEKYNLVFLGSTHPHPYKETALFSYGDLVYFLTHQEDLFMVIATERDIRMTIRTQETNSSPIPLKWYRIEPILLQYFKSCETRSLEELKKQFPEILGEELRSLLSHWTNSRFNLKVAQEFKLGLYSSSEENLEILRRRH